MSYGTPPPQPQDAPAVRASDAERDAIIARLNVAFSEGRLTQEEFSQRMESAATARTRPDLDRLVADLPPEAAAGPAATASGRTVVHGGPPGRPQWYVFPIGGLRIRGRRRLGADLVSVSVIGGADLDLGDAELTTPVVTLTQVSVIGGTRVLVPEGIEVEVTGCCLLGGRRIDVDPPGDPGAPVLRIRAFSIIGGVEVGRAWRSAADQEQAGPGLPHLRYRRRSRRW